MPQVSFTRQNGATARRTDTGLTVDRFNDETAELGGGGAAVTGTVELVSQGNDNWSPLQLDFILQNGVVTAKMYQTTFTNLFSASATIRFRDIPAEFRPTTRTTLPNITVIADGVVLAAAVTLATDGEFIVSTLSTGHGVQPFFDANLNNIPNADSTSLTWVI